MLSVFVTGQSLMSCPREVSFLWFVKIGCVGSLKYKRQTYWRTDILDILICSKSWNHLFSYRTRRYLLTFVCHNKSVRIKRTLHWALQSQRTTYCIFIFKKMFWLDPSLSYFQSCLYCPTFVLFRPLYFIFIYICSRWWWLKRFSHWEKINWSKRYIILFCTELFIYLLTMFSQPYPKRDHLSNINVQLMYKYIY